VTETAAPPAPTAPHKLSTPMIAAIGGGAVAVIGGIVALVTLLGGNDEKSPSSSRTAPVSSPAPQSTPGGSLPSQPDSGQPSPAPSDVPTSAPTGEPSAPTTDTGTTGGVDLGNGVVLIPASGWTDSGTASSGQADLFSPDNRTEFFVGTGGADSTDVLSVLSTDIQNQVQNGSFSDVSLGDAQQAETGGSVFDVGGQVPFTATVSTQQGTTEVTGTFGELLNTQTGLSAFVMFTALNDDDFQNNVDAVDQMVSSLIG
jgi:hypothetical protein